MKAERTPALPITRLEGKDLLSILFRDGQYDLAFDYIFRTDQSIPTNIIADLLTALKGRRLSFYSLSDSKLTTYVVSNSTKKAITKLLIIPKGSHRVILGSF